MFLLNIRLLSGDERGKERERERKNEIERELIGVEPNHQNVS